MNLQEIAHYAEGKTKILLSSANHEVEKLILHIINFLGQDIDFVSKETSVLNNNDFILLSSENFLEAQDFHPNIVLITDIMPNPNIDILLENIVGGGILVYPDNHITLELKLNKVDNFFRKLPFTKTSFTTTNDDFQIDTILGEVPLMTKNKDLVEKIEGIRLFCQQLGIMEEEFYEAVMNFE